MTTIAARIAMIDRPTRAHVKPRMALSFQRKFSDQLTLYQAHWPLETASQKDIPLHKPYL